MYVFNEIYQIFWERLNKPNRLIHLLMLSLILRPPSAPIGHPATRPISASLTAPHQYVVVPKSLTMLHHTFMVLVLLV